MEITKVTSFNHVPSVENNFFSDDYENNEELITDEKPFFKLFSTFKSSKNKKIDELLVDETNEFLTNLIDMKEDGNKEVYELDSEYAFKKSCNPFQYVDKISEKQEFYNEKFVIIDHQNEWEKKNMSEPVSQEEIKTEQKIVDKIKIKKKQSKDYKQQIEVVFLHFFFKCKNCIGNQKEKLFTISRKCFKNFKVQNKKAVFRL